MAQRIHLAFLWHMHQPLYRSPDDGRYILPWVRLHALKGYNDVAAMAERHPAVKQTINLVPSLLRQLKDYAEGRAVDQFSELTLKDAARLDDEDKRFILKNFFSVNWDVAVNPHPRYRELLRLRGHYIKGVDPKRWMKDYHEQDYRDLQALFNLAWFGFEARRDAGVKALIDKTKGYTEKDKRAILGKQREVLIEMLERYRRLAASDNVELSTTPFYHPILPLLMDTANAGPLATSEQIERIAFRRPEDARHQIESGLNYFAEVFGARPRGMWPSEGSVCHELGPLFSDAGVEWIATDAGVLEESVVEGRKTHLKPYVLPGTDGKGVAVFFRDTTLSDEIGFRSYRTGTKQAVGAFMDRLNALRQGAPEEGSVASVILDGENPWENYADGGEAFLTELFETLEKTDWVETTTFGGYLDEVPPTRRVARLHAGSWINRDFGIWIGGDDEKRAWQLLSAVRSRVEEELAARGEQPGSELHAEVMESIYAAEGSDWFWWFGDTFTSENDYMFDLLFRKYLLHAMRLLGLEPPFELTVPIGGDSAVRLTEPRDVIRPVIDGRITTYFEWLGAGALDLTVQGRTMATAEGGLFTSFHYGFDAKHIYIKLELGDLSLLKARNRLDIRVAEPHTFCLSLPLNKTEKTELIAWPECAADRRLELGAYAIQDVIEVALPFEALGAEAGGRLSLSFRVMKGKGELDRLPADGLLSFDVPGGDYDASMWREQRPPNGF